MFKILTLLGILALLLALHFSDIFYTAYEKDYLFTLDELSTFNGVQQPFLYIALMGTVFNVTKGAKHYGIGQQYNFFVGRDASRNFVTGKFKEEDANDDIGGLSNQEIRSLNNWMKFYKREYQRVGNLIGRYYDELGQPTPYGNQMNKVIHEAEEEERISHVDKLTFPPCNIEWDSDRGTRVWCSERSGGINRLWTGKPRQYFKTGSDTSRCACISEANEKLGNIREYPGCDFHSDSCYIRPEK